MVAGQGPQGAADWWITYADVGCSVSLELPVPGFTVKQLLSLSPGSLVVTGCSQTSHIPLRVNGELLAWSEFEMVDHRYGVRLTELA